MFLVQLDTATYTVIAVTDIAEAPVLTQLGENYILTAQAPQVGEVYDRTAKTLGPVPRKRWITNLAFDNRFTVDERVNIELAALIDPTMTIDQKRQAMALQVELGRAKKARYIDLTRADTRAAVEQFEVAGLIGVGRAAVILDTPIAEHEYHPEA